MISKLKKAIKDPKLAMRYAKVILMRGVNALPVWSVITLFEKKRGTPPPIKNLSGKDITIVDSFWGEHTVIGPELALVKTAYQSKQYLRWRAKQYPLFEELMGLYGEHNDEVVLDYGCGPGNDLVGFLLYSKAKKVIGIDVSDKALQFASHRISLHNIPLERCELIMTSDSDNRIPLDDNSVDYIYSEGVLHHISDPQAKLRELHRVLKPRGRACIMIYNADSVCLHLHVAYSLMVLEKKFQGMDLYEAFSRSTDTEDCPISRCYRPEEFLELCNNAGFKSEYAGGYLSGLELSLLEKYPHAMHDERLGKEHRQFLQDLTFEQGFPQYHGKYAGVGGVYNLYK